MHDLYDTQIKPAINSKMKCDFNIFFVQFMYFIVFKMEKKVIIKSKKLDQIHEKQKKEFKNKENKQ